MTRFAATHEIVLTDRRRRSPRLVIPVMLGPDGQAATAEEHRSGAAAAWTCLQPQGWRWQGSAGALPAGYTTLHVRRIEGRRTAIGRTTLRASEPTTVVKSYVCTESEYLEIERAARSTGKRVGRFVADAAVAEARRRKT